MDTVDAWLSNREADSPPEALLPTGEVVGAWKVVARLGGGGSSETYRVLSVRDGESAALKLLTSATERNCARFKRECELLRVQTLPCFARMVDSGEWRGHPYLVMEELESVELPDAEPAIATFLLEVCRAVASLHAEGYVHRDLKPGNVMRRRDGSIVLIDLGLAKKLDGGGCPWQPREALSVVDGGKVAVGTPGYSAPEQFLTGAADESSDVHGIGMLAYACFDGRPPRRWGRVIEKATSSIPSQRYESVRELMAGIAAATSVRPPLVKLLLAVAYLPLASGLIWMVARSAYAHYHYGAGVHQISYFVGQMIAYGAFASILPVGLTFRQSWARWLTVVMGSVFAFYLVTSPWLERGVQTLNAYALGVVCLWFCPTIIAAILLMVPSVARWYGR